MSDVKATTNAGTIDDPIPQELIWKDAQGKFYKVAGTGGSSVGGGTDAGLVQEISDRVDDDRSGVMKIAASPLAVKTVKDQVGDLTLLETGSKTSVVEAINELSQKSAAGGGGGGIVKSLSDRINDSRTSKDFVASSPIAVKTVNDKIGELSTLQTSTKSNIVNAINEIVLSGGAGGGQNPDAPVGPAVSTPRFTYPIFGAVNVSVAATIQATPFKSSEPSLTLVRRMWSIDTSPSFDSGNAIEEYTDTSFLVIGVDTRDKLKPNTKYFVSCQDMASNGLVSGKATTSFTTGDNVAFVEPTVTLKGIEDSPTNIGSGIKIVVSDVSAVDKSDLAAPTPSVTHTNTDYVITSERGVIIWEKRDCTGAELTTIVVPEGTLAPSESYSLTVTVKGTKQGGAKISDGIAIKHFRTTEASKIVAPVVLVHGFPDRISTVPVVGGGVFSVINGVDTHVATEIKVLLSENMSEVHNEIVQHKTTNVRVPQGKLQPHTQYKAMLRYKGAKYGWSSWGEQTFTTNEVDLKYFHIGVPGQFDFGVGLADDETLANMDVPLSRLPNSETPNHVQYGLYKGVVEETINDDEHFFGTNEIYLKCIPKFYYTFLQHGDKGTNLTDDELRALLPYVEVTLGQMKEAQRRSPCNAMVVAPSYMFKDEADALDHGFLMLRAFRDGGEEKPCFFMTNMLSSCHKYKDVWRHGQPDNDMSINANYDFLRMNDYDNVHKNYIGKFSFNNCKPYTKVDNLKMAGPHCFAWAALSILSLIQGQYATNTDSCAWYDKNLQTNFPKGINSFSTLDHNDSTVRVNNKITDYSGDMIANNYTKTTHNGCVSGITHVAGWYWVPFFATSTTATAKSRIAVLKDEDKLIDWFKQNKSNIVADTNLKVLLCGEKLYWGHTSITSFYKIADAALHKDLMVLNGVYDRFTVKQYNSLEFGNDHSSTTHNSNYVVATYNAKDNDSLSGIFSRSNMHESNNVYASLFLTAYPNKPVVLPATVSVTGNAENATPTTQSVDVPYETTLGNAKAKLVTPTATNHEFKEWQV